MSSVRPEVLTFMRAAQALMSLEAQDGPLPLSDDDTEKIEDCMAKLERMLQDATVSMSDGDFLKSLGDGQPHSDGHLDGDGHSGR